MVEADDWLSRTEGEECCGHCFWKKKKEKKREKEKKERIDQTERLVWYDWLGEEEWGIRSWDERTENSDHRRTEPLICRASGQCLNKLEFQGTLEEIEGLLMRGEGGEGKIANRLLLVLLLRMLLLLTGWRTPLPLRMLLPAKSSLKRSLVEVLVTDRVSHGFYDGSLQQLDGQPLSVVNPIPRIRLELDDRRSPLIPGRLKSKPNLTISSNTTSNSSNNSNSPFVQRFDQRVSRQRRSTEAPMDFVYQSSKPQKSVDHHYQSSSSSLPQIKPLRLIDLIGNQLISNHSSSSSCQVESMDWKPSPKTLVVENSSSDKDCRCDDQYQEKICIKINELATHNSHLYPSIGNHLTRVTIVGAGGTNSPQSETLKNKEAQKK
ncbi:hypothetical protein PPACK8108_LOCUS16440 [Phakopsora pachyrhizi]|uniref:Uncharacterized protein n=1 Tax=Phakopsora pachyrhizi TaxID=170000 RepID=A0AAV0B838_PHAPC|nr:hypothetical protein PPACK8108_LOCUS16440 [Phakopsora pachyrhizi]